MIGDALDLRLAFRPDPLQERRQRIFVEPGRGLGARRHGGQFVRRDGGAQIAENVRFAKARLAVFRHLHDEKPFVDDVTEAVHGLRPVEVQPRRRFVLQGAEAGAPGEGVTPAFERVKESRDYRK